MADETPRKGFFRRLWARKWVRITTWILVVLTPVAAYAGNRGWRYIKTDPQFCVGCHLMETPAEKWRESAHHVIACQTCHRADIFQEMSFGYAAFIERKKEIGRHTKLDIMICAECHVQPEDTRWDKIAHTPGHKTHFVDRQISCLVCHVTKLHSFRADTEACTQCHGKNKLTLDKMAGLHCLGCHDFAAKKWDVLIPTANECRSCHPAERAPGVALTSLDGSTITVPKGHEDCLGCHRPHGKKLDDPVDCLSCHRKLLDASSKHSKDERLTRCSECHVPHEKKK